MLRGFTTVTFFTDDMEAAKAWYTEVFELEPYFNRDNAYIEWRVGDYQHEFGLLDTRYAPHPPGKGAIIYWAVDDVEAAYERLLRLGAQPYAEPIERGPGFVTASVIDPFGNVLGVMFNQHYLDVCAVSGSTA
ncbi:VOC family protein [Actinoplanes sp. NEAU-A11]|uniref:VOC family protein n=2 Tax=Actinoplanes aureus TaxID=2792083 RepID=A0A931C2Q8_9ACTN|nr:VOC family protein [Actinoplanes aureus]